MVKNELNVPDFDDLPKAKGPKGREMEEGCAWGVFDKNGKKDVFGTLNFLTPSVIKEAYKEAKDGEHVSLNWPIGSIKTPGFGRKGLVHKVINFVDSPLNCHGYDDEIEFNTQCSSQWDSLCHYHHQPSASGYNNTQTSVEELLQHFGDEDKDQKVPTLNHWHSRGGMVARGVFIDFLKWAEEKGRKFNQFDADVISLKDIEECAKAEGVSFKPGDVLIIRSGFTEKLGQMNGDQQAEAMSSHRVCGVESSKEAAKWIWNNHFAGVAGDMIAFEHIPPKLEDGSEGTVAELVLHQYLLGFFGCHIGELWDLKALSEHCAKTKRYTFLLTSVPLNVPGQIGSPPNVLALF